MVPLSQLYQTFNTWTQRRNEFYVDFEKQPQCMHTHTHAYCVHTDTSETKVSEAVLMVCISNAHLFSFHFQFSLVYFINMLVKLYQIDLTIGL